jgi:hypothetical protein
VLATDGGSEFSSDDGGAADGELDDGWRGGTWMHVAG